ncbi:MAG: class I SAM-dependent methyltransferase [Tepidiformaceae bacterium]
MTANQAQRERWNDEGFARSWPKRERFTTAITPALLEAAALRPGERVLEIGSGGGLAAIAAARAVAPGGDVTGFDLSAPLTKMASARAAEAGLANARFVSGDAQVDELPAGPFDVAISQFGVMFFEDPVAAFGNVRWRLRAGGRLAFACWQPAAANTWFPGSVVAPFQPPVPTMNLGDGPAPGPFAFGDEGRVRDILSAAGFVGIGRQARAINATVPLDSLIDREMVKGLGVPPELEEKAMAAVEAHYATMRTAAGELAATLSIQLFTASNP